MRIHLDYSWVVGFSQPLGSPCGMKLSQCWCASQPFARLLWGWYILWSSWILTGVWPWLSPGGTDIFWDLASFWPTADCGNLAWVHLKYPNLVVSPFQDTCTVPTSVFCPKFLPPSSGTCLTSPSQSMLVKTIFGGWPTFPQRRGRSWKCREAKCDNKLENKLEGLVGLGVLFLFTLSASHKIWFLDGLVTPPLWDLINFLDDDSFQSPNFNSSAQRSTTNFSEALPLCGGSAISLVYLGTILNSSLEFEISLPTLCKLSINLLYPWVWILAKPV